MEIDKINLKDTSLFSHLICDLISENKNIEEFISAFPSISNVEKNLHKNINLSNRKVLSDVLISQYNNTVFKDIDNSLVFNNIKSLTDPKTQIVTTGHQLNIFASPLFLMYKITSIIATSIKLNEMFNQYSFIPCFWMATEDHDFEEINKIKFNKTQHIWNEDTNDMVGNLTSSKLLPILEDMKGDMCKTKYGQELFNLYQHAYSKNLNYANATRAVLTSLFREHGVLIIDGNHKDLKKIMVSDFQQEIRHGFVFDMITNTNNMLSKKYHCEINPLVANIFYIKDNIRGKIIFQGNKYYSSKHDACWTKEELLNEVESSPDYFSPNVFLRTLYQERLLSSIIYLGGPSEISYWIQLKNVFSSRGVSYPIVGLRSFFLILSKQVLAYQAKCNINNQDLFLPKYEIIRKILQDKSSVNLDLLSSELDQLILSFRALLKDVDNLPDSILDIFKTKTFKELSKIKTKVIKLEKNNKPQVLNDFTEMYKGVFPNGIIQEKSSSFIPYYIKYGSSFFELLIKETIAFDKKYIILKEKV